MMKKDGFCIKKKEQILKILTPVGRYFDYLEHSSNALQHDNITSDRVCVNV